MIDDDPIAALRERIRSTAQAADRLAGEATGDGATGAAGATADDARREAQALAALLAMLRDVLPEELRHQVSDLIRQVLLLVRAVIDYYLLRLEPRADPAGSGGPGEPVVEDIPLD